MQIFININGLLWFLSALRSDFIVVSWSYRANPLWLFDLLIKKSLKDWSFAIFLVILLKITFLRYFYPLKQQPYSILSAFSYHTSNTLTNNCGFEEYNSFRRIPLRTLLNFCMTRSNILQSKFISILADPIQKLLLIRRKARIGTPNRMDVVEEEM